MKKFIMALLVIVMIASMFTGCSSDEGTDKNEIEQVEVSDVKSVDGMKVYEIFQNEEFYIFQSWNAGEYLNFLSNLDETKYEIIDISTSMQAGHYGSGEFYMVTYKEITE